MSRPSFSLAIRSLTVTRPAASQWVCRRCLATQAQSAAEAPAVSSPLSETATYDPTLPASQRIGPDGKYYRLKKSDQMLKKPLNAHPIPVTYLQHSTSSLLPESEKAQREETVTHKRIVGVVVSSGLMDKTVRVRVGGQTWNKRIGKYLKSHENHLVHDPNNSLRTGDVVSLHRLQVSRRVGHVVASIVSAFGEPVSARAPIPTPDERLAAYKEKRFAKLERRALRARAADGDAGAIDKLKAQGLDSGNGARAGVGKGNVRTERGVRLGAKGQKLPEGILPGGKREVGPIGKRARENKGKAMKFEEKVVDNVEAEIGAEEREKQ